MQTAPQRLAGLIASRAARVGVIGLGYVGVPLALAAAEAGFPVVGFDINAERVARLNEGASLIRHIPDARMRDARASGRFEATADFARLGEADVIVICVPTPLTRQREPDLSFVAATARAIRDTLRAGQLVVLESTTWPGTTREIVKPVLEETGLASGRDFLLAYSPEREDPGNASFATHAIPRVVGGDGPQALACATAFYDALVVETVPVTSLEAAEAVKLTENIFRAVNIALVNELKGVYRAMGVDIWEVVDAAKTKPFGFMPFYPGPGLGGHCIPIDPFYLTWKAREFDIVTRFIELAGEINTAMPHRVVDDLAAALDRSIGRGLNGARVLVLGVAYKKNVDDTRESPALKLIDLIEARGGACDYHDPFIAALPVTRAHPALAGRRSVALAPEALARYDAALVATDHDGVDYAAVARHVPLIVDTRNVFARSGIRAAHIVKA
ncbi:nucleotide sugar dehydrogenase [Pseudochelatococcus sp. B33]